MMPEQLTHYRILQKLGSGGMGEVYLGEDLILGRRVAIKVLLPKYTRDAERLGRFRREARAISALSHPNIVTVYEYCSESGIDFFVTEYVAGRTLRDASERGGIDVVEIATAIADALAAAHRASIIHRDIKPENILISDTGVVKLVDFGLAKLLTDEGNALAAELETVAGTFMGTAPYMSPEQIRGEEVDGRADVFSFGVVLYELLARRRPFAGRTLHDTSASILARDPEPLPRSTDPAIAALVMRMLEKSRDRRPTAAEVLASLRGIRSAAELGDTAVRPERVDTPFEPSSNLPAETTALIGRNTDVARVVELLTREEVRLVTITGTGGSGKTRVALRIASELLPRFSGGVFFVPLEHLTDPSLILSAIARATGVAESANESLDSTIARAWRDRRVLLVLDNFEQVIDAAPLVASLLTRTAAVKCLVTSQLALQIRSEHEYALDPLHVPADDAVGEELMRSPAVALFASRARAVRRDFELTAENARDVATICRLLDGLPLAVELAAARVKLLGVSAIVERLSDPMQLLTGGARDLPARQRALRSTLEWSHGLLSDREKLLFARLGVFRGGWSFEAAVAVCGFDAVDVEESLGGLVDKNLVRRLGADDEVRFAMLEPIRLLAVEKLREARDAEAVVLRHAEWTAAFAEEAARHAVGPELPLWLHRVAVEEKNVWAALDGAVEHGWTAIGLRIACGIWRYWHGRGIYSEGRRYLANLLARREEADGALRIAALFAAGVLADAQGDHADARRRFEEQLEIARSHGDRWAEANAMNNLAVAAAQTGEIERAATLHEEVYAHWLDLGNAPAAALSLQNLGNLDRGRGRLSQARERYRASVEAFRRIGDRRGVALSLTYLGALDRDERNFSSALALYEESLQIFIELGDHAGVASCMAEYGETARLGGEYPTAHELLEESLLILRELGNRKAAAQVLESIAALASNEARPDQALLLAAAAAAIRRDLRIGGSNEAIGGAITLARSALGASAEAVWQKGLALSFDQAVDAAQSGAV